MKFANRKKRKFKISLFPFFNVFFKDARLKNKI